MTDRIPKSLNFQFLSGHRAIFVRHAALAKPVAMPVRIDTTRKTASRLVNGLAARGTSLPQLTNPLLKKHSIANWSRKCQPMNTASVQLERIQTARAE